jgi:hypothetical protein
MARAQVGSGTEKCFGKISGAKEIKTDKSDGERQNATKRAYTVACGLPWYAKQHNGLAGGAKGTWDHPKDDCLPGEENT